MLGQTPRFRLGRRALFGAAAILAVTGALMGGIVLPDQLAGSEREQTGGTPRAEASVPPARQHVAHPPGEMLTAAAVESAAAEPAAPPVAEPVAPPAPPVASPPAEPTRPE